MRFSNIEVLAYTSNNRIRKAGKLINLNQRANKRRHSKSSGSERSDEPEELPQYIDSERAGSSVTYFLYCNIVNLVV